MPKETDKPQAPATRTGSLSRSVRARRPHPGLMAAGGVMAKVLDALAQPSLGLGVFVAVAFAVVCSTIAIWTRNQTLVAVGRVMDETRLVRREMQIPDEGATKQARELARQSTPRVFVADQAVFDSIITSLENLPQTLAPAENVTAVDSNIREEFGLTAEMLAAVKGQVVDGQASSAWQAKVRSLSTILHHRPLLESQTWQRARQEGPMMVRLVDGDREPVFAERNDLINTSDKELRSTIETVARGAGFTGSLQALVVNRLALNPRPTFTYDSTATAQAQAAAEALVKPVVRESVPGQVIFQRGDILTQAQLDLFKAEQEHFRQGWGDGNWQGLVRNASIVAACLTITLALAGYTLLFCPRVKRNASRMGGVALTLALSLAVACIGAATAPNLAVLFTITPTLFVTMLLCIAYDRRAALAYALLQGLLVCISLRESVGTMAVLITGIACIVWTLKEIRDRNSLFRTSVVTGIGTAAATIVFSLIERPLGPEVAAKVFKETLFDAVLAGGGAILVGGIMLFMLPLIERAFNITTGMTLIDLRDPKQPLLRELQQRAPGTYNHSLNVAAIAEAAAEAIGGDGLLTYVGALYHDVGKMNKPEYFVENQAGGPNKHDKLSPAMSLLVVVGHVKDGLELAREFNLPGRIQHFIEAHHGTTLVEFFFHRACKQAQTPVKGNELDECYVPDEFEYRYPGPKPRTKEAAILMIADSVESAARAMPEPTPSRIDSLVRGIANKRLLDGQFDDCELTLKDLNQIVESISRTVASMYHGRIAYPAGAVEEQQVVEQRA
jgi:putative nucleotidyltransferase with HDIG domain